MRDKLTENYHISIAPIRRETPALQEWLKSIEKGREEQKDNGAIPPR